MKKIKLSDRVKQLERRVAKLESGGPQAIKCREHIIKKLSKGPKTKGELIGEYSQFVFSKVKKELDLDVYHEKGRWMYALRK